MHSSTSQISSLVHSDIKSLCPSRQLAVMFIHATRGMKCTKAVQKASKLKWPPNYEGTACKPIVYQWWHASHFPETLSPHSKMKLIFELLFVLVAECNLERSPDAILCNNSLLIAIDLAVTA